MNIHKNARLTRLRREEMALAVLDAGLTKAQAARIYGVTSKIVSRRVERHKTGGRAAMMDRSSRPKLIPGQIAQDFGAGHRIVRQAPDRQADCHGSRRVPGHLSRILKPAGLSRMKDIEPAEPVLRYEYGKPRRPASSRHQAPGPVRARRSPHHRRQDGPEQFPWRGMGICPCLYDDASRIAFTDIVPDEKAVSDHFPQGFGGLL